MRESDNVVKVLLPHAALTSNRKLGECANTFLAHRITRLFASRTRPRRTFVYAAKTTTTRGPLAKTARDAPAKGGTRRGPQAHMSALVALFHVCSATALALQHHDPALFWKHVDSRLSAVGDSEDTKRLRRFASTAFDVLRGCSCSAPLAAGQECDVPFPGLTAQPWWDTEAFEWAEAVEAIATSSDAKSRRRPRRQPQWLRRSLTSDKQTPTRSR